MDIFSVIGLVIGCALVVFGIISGGGTADQFIDIPSMAIVFGGTFGALFISYPFEMFKMIPKHFKLVFGKNPYDAMQYIQQIVDLAQEARKKGLLALEEKAADIEDKFLYDSIMLIVDAIEPDRVKRILETQVDYIDQRHDYVVGFYDRGAALAPAFGMIGTVIGLINMLGNLEMSDPSILGVGMSLALITTLYGSLLANLLFTPISSKLIVLHEQERLCLELIIEGVVSIQAGENPRHIEQKLISFLPVSMQEEEIEDIKEEE